MPVREVDVPLPVLRARQQHLDADTSIRSNPYAPGTMFHDLWLAEFVQDTIEDEEAILALVRERGRLGK